MSRLEKLLLALAVVLIVAVGGLAFMIWRLPGLGSPPPTPPSSGPLPGEPENGAVLLGGNGEQTALLAYALAQQEATAWAADAQMVNVTGTWSQVKQVQEVTSGATPWHFTFLSPARGALLRLSVNGTQVGQSGETAVAAPPQLQAVGEWQIDSDEAIRALFDAGGREFLQRTRPVALTATLNTAGEPISWFISLVERSSGESFTVYVDAGTGAVLRREPAS